MDNVTGVITDPRGREWQLAIDPEKPETVRISPSWAKSLGVELDIATLTDKVFTLQHLATIEYAANK